VTILLLPHDSSIEKSMIPMLHWQSGLFGRGTQNLVLRNQLADAMAALDRELQVVGQIQRSLLPSRLPTIPGIEIAAHYVTSARAGGDYYDFFPLDDGAWGVFIADVSGHGTPAAVIMAITHALAHARPGAHTPPGALLTYLNEQLARTYTRGNGTFVTAFYAVLDPAARALTYASAGHNPPRLVRAGRVMSLDRGAGLPLGLVGDETYDESEVSLAPRDLLLLYTDGITEAMAPPTNGAAPRELFGIERLDRLLIECDARAPGECVERICAAVTAFTVDAPPKDDQTLIAMRQV
jgi:sigma-B regulation protein RsbU (phosphoserine phosphatase)